MAEKEDNGSGVEQQEPWFHLVTRMAVRLRKRFGTPDQKMEARMMRVFRSALRPRKRAGRRPNDVTVRAARMWLSGMQGHTVGKGISLRHHHRRLWQKIYRDVFPDYAHWDKLMREHETSILRRNVKAYLRRARSQMPEGD
jgi:hypothetical protein